MNINSLNWFPNTQEELNSFISLYVENITILLPPSLHSTANHTPHHHPTHSPRPNTQRRSHALHHNTLQLSKASTTRHHIATPRRLSRSSHILVLLDTAINHFHPCCKRINRNRYIFHHYLLWPLHLWHSINVCTVRVKLFSVNTWRTLMAGR